MQVSVISFTFMISCVEILCAYLHSHNPLISNSYIQLQIGTMAMNQITWL